MTKRCSRCKLDKELNNFHKHVGRPFGVSEYCKPCRNDKVVSERFNLKPGELKALFDKHENKCSICEKHKSEFVKGLAVDHCHETGKIRGLLCCNCNNGLGRFKDNINFLSKAIKYLGENK